MGVLAVGTTGAARVGVGSVRTNATAVAFVIQPLTGSALFTVDGAFDEIEGSLSAVSADRGLAGTAIFSNGACLTGCRARRVVPKVSGVGTGCAARAILKALSGG